MIKYINREQKIKKINLIIRLYTHFINYINILQFNLYKIIFYVV